MDKLFKPLSMSYRPPPTSPEFHRISMLWFRSAVPAPGVWLISSIRRNEPNKKITLFGVRGVALCIRVWIIRPSTVWIDMGGDGPTWATKWLARINRRIMRSRTGFWHNRNLLPSFTIFPHGSSTSFPQVFHLCHRRGLWSIAAVFRHSQTPW